MTKHIFTISQVVTDTEFLEKSEKLDNAINNDNLLDFCMFKTNECYERSNNSLGLAWRLLSTHFYPDENERRNTILNVLGYSNVNQLAQQMQQLNTSDSRQSNHTNFSFDNETIMTDSPDRIVSPIISPAALQQQGLLPVNIEAKEDGSIGSFLNRCILTGDIDKGVERCVSEAKWPEALLLGWFAAPHSIPATLKSYFSVASSSNSEWSSLLWFVISSRLSSEVPGVVESDSIQQLVNSVHLKYWQETLAFILRESIESNFRCNQDDLINTLAQRLLAQTQDGNPGWIVPALYCYVLSGNFESVAKYCQGALGDFLGVIEMLLVLQKTTQGVVDAPAANALLSRYAQLLVNQGKLNEALNYLRITNADAELQQRIEFHLRPPAPVQQQVHRGPAAQRFRNTSSSSNIYNRPQQQSPLSQPPPQQYGQPSGPYGGPVNNQGGGYGFAPPPQQASMYQPAPQQYQPPPPANVGPPPTGPLPSASNLQNLRRPSATNAAPPPSGPASYGNYGGPPVAAVPPFNSNNFQPQQQPLPSPPIQQQPGGYFQPRPTSAAPPPMHQMQPIAPPPQIPYQQNKIYEEPPRPSSTMSSGWNDPPPISGSNKQFARPAPPAPAFEPLPLNSMQPQMQSINQYAPPPQQQFQGQSRPRTFSSSTLNAIPEPAPEPVKLSPEDQQLLDVYESLLQRIQQQLQIMQVPQNVRRKADDVAQKLQVLRTRLGEKSLSPSTLAGLKDISAAVQASDYHSAMNVHAHVVGSSTFGETAAFLPSLKVLLHLGQQYAH